MATRNNPVRMIAFAMWTQALVPLGLLLGHLRCEVFKIVHRILESHGAWQYFRSPGHSKNWDIYFKQIFCQRFLNQSSFYYLLQSFCPHKNRDYYCVTLICCGQKDCKAFYLISQVQVTWLLHLFTVIDDSIKIYLKTQDIEFP